MFYVCLTIFAAAIVAVDQWTKALAAAQLTDVVDVLVPGWLELRYLLNDGMALSMFRGGRWVFVALTVVFFAFVVWIIAKKHLTKKPELWCLAAITGGAIGNLIDRVRTGAVSYTHLSLKNVCSGVIMELRWEILPTTEYLEAHHEK